MRKTVLVVLVLALAVVSTGCASSGVARGIQVIPGSIPGVNDIVRSGIYGTDQAGGLLDSVQERACTAFPSKLWIPGVRQCVDLYGNTPWGSVWGLRTGDRLVGYANQCGSRFRVPVIASGVAALAGRLITDNPYIVTGVAAAAGAGAWAVQDCGKKENAVQIADVYGNQAVMVNGRWTQYDVAPSRPLTNFSVTGGGICRSEQVGFVNETEREVGIQVKIHGIDNSGQATVVNDGMPIRVPVGASECHEWGTEYSFEVLKEAVRTSGKIDGIVRLGYNPTCVETGRDGKVYIRNSCQR